MLWKESLCGYTDPAPYNDKEGVLIADDQNQSMEERTMAEMKKISIEDLEKINGGGDYDFIHYTDGKSCHHYPARVL